MLASVPLWLVNKSPYSCLCLCLSCLCVTKVSPSFAYDTETHAHMSFPSNTMSRLSIRLPIVHLNRNYNNPIVFIIRKLSLRLNTSHGLVWLIGGVWTQPECPLDLTNSYQVALSSLACHLYFRGTAFIVRFTSRKCHQSSLCSNLTIWVWKHFELSFECIALIFN